MNRKNGQKPTVSYDMIENGMRQGRYERSLMFHSMIYALTGGKRSSKNLTEG